MNPHGAIEIAYVDNVRIYLRERTHNITKLDLKLHNLVLPRDLTHVRELHYRFVNGNIVGECKVWLYGTRDSNIALILDYWCNMVELFEKLLRYVIDEMKLYYKTSQIYIHILRCDDDNEERKLLGKSLRRLGFTLINDEYAILVI